MGRIAAYSTFGDFSNPPANALAARLAAHAPMEDAKVFLASGGGDAIDTAAKIARRHWVLQGQPERVHLLSRTNGYHGTHGFGTSIGGIEANTANWGPLVPHTSAVAFDSLPALEQEILRVGPERVRRVLLRAGDRRRRRAPPARGLHRGRRGPVRGARDPARHRLGDLRLRPARHLVRDRALARRQAGHDHVRQGRHQRLPAARRRRGLGRRRRAVLRRAGRADAPPRRDLRRAPELLRRRDGRPRRLRGGGPDRARPRARGAAARRARAARRATPRSARSARASGCSAAVELSEQALADDPAAVGKVAAGAREAGVLVRPLLRGVAVSPPLTLGQEHIDELAAAIRRRARPPLSTRRLLRSARSPTPGRWVRAAHARDAARDVLDPRPRRDRPVRLLRRARRVLAGRRARG